MPGNTNNSYPTLPLDYSYDPQVITKSLSAGLCIIDRDMKIVWVNKVLENWFAPLNKIKGKYCYQIYENRKKICPGCPCIKIFEHGLNECMSLRRNIVFANGQKRHVKLTATPIRDNKGSIVQVLELAEDVTEEVNMENGVKKKLHIVSAELDFISKLDKQFIYSPEFTLDKVLEQAVGIAPVLLNSKMCNLRLVDGSKKILMSRASKGLSKNFTENVIMEVGDGITGKVAATKQPMVIRDVLANRKVKFIDYIKKEGIRSSICVPIILKNEILGTLTIYDKKIGAFTNDDCKLLMYFANHIAILIDNVKAHKKIFVSYINTIKSLVSAVEARDAYTSGHAEKVTKFALDIASVVKLPKRDRIMLSYCGRLHDIGKIAISDVILNKRGSLTASERAEVEMHPVKGVEILSNLKFLEEGIPAIKHHHERYDGKGYPDGIKGRDIPILARIICCADAFDAMTSDRAYRPKMSIEEALTELRLNRRRQFDPDILDVFLSIIKSKSLA